MVAAVLQGQGCGPGSFTKSFATLKETTDAFPAVGFEIVEAELAPGAWVWWEEYCRHGCREAEAQVILADGGRWITFGYVIAKKPEEK